MARTRYTGRPVENVDSQNEESDIRRRGHASHRRRRGKAPMVEEPVYDEAEYEQEVQYFEHLEEQGLLDEDDQHMVVEDGVDNEETGMENDGEGSDVDGDDGEEEDEDGEERERDDGAKKEIKRRLKQMDEADKKLTSFPGGPMNLSVLGTYSTHIAGRVWRSYVDQMIPDRPLLRFYNHDKRLRADVLEGDQFIIGVLQRSGLAPLLGCRYTIYDRGLISAFAERWHPDTSSFHLPCGEMTITLDDVAAILHIPIRGKFFTLPVLDAEQSVAVLVDQLKVTQGSVASEILRNKGSSVRFIWLEKVIRAKMGSHDGEAAAKAYMLRLLGITLFADKTRTRVGVRYLSLLTDLDDVGNFAWGAAALAYMYDCLQAASRRSTLSLSGYTTLLQAWIYEHFPASLFSRKINAAYTEEMPRARRWGCVKSDGSIAEKRANLDDISGDVVIWTPYDQHRAAWPFDDISLHSGWIRCSGICRPHQPRRVLRQYGFIQVIPGHPLIKAPIVDIIDQMWHMYNLYLTHVFHRAITPAQTAPDYFPWYRQVSHPYMIPPEIREVGTASAAGRFALLAKYLDIATDPERSGAPPEGSDVWVALQNMQAIVSQSLHGDLVYTRSNRRGTRGSQASRSRQ